MGAKSVLKLHELPTEEMRSKSLSEDNILEERACTLDQIFFWALDALQSIRHEFQTVQLQGILPIVERDWLSVPLL